MIEADQVITIEAVKHIEAHKLELLFNDGTRRLIDFFPFLSTSLNPHIRKYLDPEAFLKFEIDNGDLEWNDYDLCFPIWDLYEGEI